MSLPRRVLTLPTPLAPFRTTDPRGSDVRRVRAVKPVTPLTHLPAGELFLRPHLKALELLQHLSHVVESTDLGAIRVGRLITQQ